jgi:hypothetical protein
MTSGYISKQIPYWQDGAILGWNGEVQNEGGTQKLGLAWFLHAYSDH